MGTTLDYTVVLEWENARRAGRQRALGCVARMAEQMRAQPRSGELLVVHREAACDGAKLASWLEPLAEELPLRLLAVRRLRYYQLKNAGARAARGRIVVFFDSDLRLESGCLAALLEAVEVPLADIVAGYTYAEQATFYEKALGLVWSYPLRPGAAGPHPAKTFYANNAAARRDLWLRYPFQDERVRYREMCVDVARRLRDDGGSVWRLPAACAAHPPPQPFVGRALREGRDRVYKLRRTRGLARSTLSLASWSGRRLRRAALRIARDRCAVDLPRAGVPVALGLALGYWSLAFAGGVQALCCPALVGASLREQPGAGGVSPPGA